jgi:predicted dehydrogenase
MIAAHFLIGHGCAPGQEKTWKLNAERAGGGCLIDPGVHLLDLCLLLAPERIEVVGGTTWSGFWNTGIEEDVQLLLKASDISISLHISIVCWRSTFRMELHGTDGYGLVSGRGRSYGSQKYVTGQRWGWRLAPSQAASEIAIVESDGTDVYSAELEELLFPNVNSERAWPGPSTATEALRVMELLDCIRERLKLPRNYA